MTTKNIKEALEKINEDRRGLNYLTEKIHEKLHDILNSNIDSSRKLNIVSGTVRQMVKNGEDTGLESSKPKRGSSRAVFFPKQAKEITVDGTPTKTHSVVKVAYPGYLDRYNKSGSLFGEQQNATESDHYINQTHGILTQGDKEGEFHTNPHGILPPHFGHHEDYHHLEMGRVAPVSAKEFKENTKTHEFPSGITHDDYYNAVNHFWEEAHGQTALHGKSRANIDKLMNHPLVDSTVHLISNSDMHPCDLKRENMGLWEHPITKKKHVVISDYGYSNKIMQGYREATKAMLADQQ